MQRFYIFVASLTVHGALRAMNAKRKYHGNILQEIGADCRALQTGHNRSVEAVQDTLLHVPVAAYEEERPPAEHSYKCY